MLLEKLKREIIRQHFIIDKAVKRFISKIDDNFLCLHSSFTFYCFFL